MAEAVPTSDLAPQVEKLQALNRALNKTPIPPCFDKWESLNVTDDLVFIYLTHMKDPSERAAFHLGRLATTVKLRQVIQNLDAKCSTAGIIRRVYQDVR